VHVNCFWYFLWHTWRVISFEAWTQTLTSVHTVLKLTSTWSASPGPNLPTFTWRTVRHMATAGKHRVYHKRFLNSACRDYCTFSVHLLLSTVAYAKPVHLQWTGSAQCKDNQLAVLSLHINPCCIVVGCVSRLVAVRLNISSKLIENTT